MQMAFKASPVAYTMNKGKGYILKAGRFVELTLLSNHWHEDDFSLPSVAKANRTLSHDAIPERN
jgi:hypothetical protein